MKRFFAMGCFLLGVSLWAANADAQTTVDTNGTSGNGSSAGTWTGGVIPNNDGPTYDVQLSNTPCPVVISLDINATMDSPLIQNSSAVFPNSGTTLAVSGSVDNSGFLDTFGGARLNMGGSFTNEASGQPYLGGPGDTFSADTLNNVASVYVRSGSTVSVGGSVDSSGARYTSGGTLTVGGSFTNEAGANLDLGNPGDIVNLRSLNNMGDPASLFLFGTGFLAVAYITRRRFRFRVSN
ncbi:MAG: hypothetical protein WA020_15420 [Candidatus Acidiferrales bacterium]